MRKFIIALALIALLIIPSACSGDNESGESETLNTPSPADYDDATYNGSSKNEEPSFTGSDAENNDTERLIIHSGSISIAVTDISASNTQISNLAQSLGGYVVYSSISGEGLDMRGWITIKVPAESFTQALDSLEAMGEELISRNINTSDITEEYMDLDARLRNAEATEQQYLALLERADTVSETLQIYNSLSSIRSEIEVLKGRINYLDKSVEMSQISVYLEPVELADPFSDISWDIGKMFKTALKGLAQFGQWLLTGIVWVLIFSPLWLPLLIIGIKKWKGQKK